MNENVDQLSAEALVKLEQARVVETIQESQRYLNEENPEVIKIGVDRARICAFFYILLGFSHVVSSVLRGLGRPVMPMVVMLVCWCAVRVVVLMTIGQSVHSLYLTHWLYPITWGLSSIVYVFDLRKYKLFTSREQLS